MSATEKESTAERLKALGLNKAAATTAAAEEKASTPLDERLKALGLNQAAAAAAATKERLALAIAEMQKSAPSTSVATPEPEAKSEPQVVPPGPLASDTTTLEGSPEIASEPVAAPTEVTAVDQATSHPSRKPTLRDVVSGEFSVYAKRWMGKGDSKVEFDPEVVEKIYASLKRSSFDTNQIMALEFNSYLEKYLWPCFDGEKASPAHLLSIALLINQKVADASISAWDSIALQKENFSKYFERMLELWKAKTVSLREKTYLLQFLINCFQSLEQDFVRQCCLKLTNLQSWFHLNELHREKLLSANKKLMTFWKKVQKKYADPKTPAAKNERDFMAELLDEFLASIENFGAKETLSSEEIAFLERAVELLIDLLDQLPTRRFFRPLLVDKHFVVRCRGSKVAEMPQARLLNQLLGILRYYENFEIDDTTGGPLSRRDITDLHYERLQLLQRVCFQEFPDNAALRQVTMMNVSALDTRDAMQLHFGSLPLEILKVLCAKVCYLDVSKDATLAAMETAARVAQEELDKKEAEKEQAEGAPKKKRKKKKQKTEEEERLRKLLVEILINRLQRPSMQQDDIEKMPLYPTEKLIWDPNLVPEEHYSGDYSLALPKLNLQFLTIHDYLLRNFNLFRLESTYEVREDIHDQLPRLKAYQDREGYTQFQGKARMCLPLQGLEVMNVKRPRVGETVPSEVRAEVKFSLTGLLPHVRAEWDALREHDVIFFVRIEAPEVPYEGKVSDLTVAEFPERFGITIFRGGEVTELLDDEGNVINEPNPAERKAPVGDNRVARVLLDPAQYHLDLEAVSDGAREVYNSFNIVMRRKPKENNFKAILQTIRSLMDNENTVVPDWLHDLFLGYGDPGAAQYWKLPTALDEIDFRDTFLDQDHILESFPDVEDIDIPEDLERPFKLKFEKGTPPEAGKRPPEVITASAYKVPNMGPYPECKPRENSVRFTPMQVEAIRSGVNPGLTMVVGPPGTGKTDTAVQVVNLLFHNFPDQKMVLVAHSNQALNDLFEKIIALDIPERYLLRLGRGIEELDAKQDFSKWGRVNHMLQRRLDLLAKVERLAETFGLSGQDAGYTCENAQHFFLHHVVYRWEEYLKNLKVAGKDGASIDKVILRRKEREAAAKRHEEEAKRAEEGNPPEEDGENKGETEGSSASGEKPEGKAAKKRRVEVAEEGEPEELVKARELLKSGKRTVAMLLFPFIEFFQDAPQPLFPGESYEADLEIAEGCFRYFKGMFSEIEECRAFELLRNGHDRGNYLITTHARIIAMTCTHASLTRQNLVNLNFKYDNLIMEESAQILEVETFIPMLLQQSERGVSRLKRVMFIGDHHQLPPVVKNRAFQKYGHLDQSLYARFVRLQTPTVDLNLQGRARPEIAALYSWRYRGLGDLPRVESDERYRKPNRGLSYNYQFINVDDFQGQGETTPQPHFYQNLGEAEYCVALFMYLRLLGYPAEKITIITTYNGQKALLRDVVKQRCSWNPLFGEPSKITTVDKFQGQQNDFVIVSLVRTGHVGHLRDVRRLIVTMSRSRFGLYVFGRFSLFENCFELTPAMSRFARRPRELHLELDENETSDLRPTGEPLNPTVVTDLHHMWKLLQDKMQAQFQAAAALVAGAQAAT